MSKDTQYTCTLIPTGPKLGKAQEVAGLVRNLNRSEAGKINFFTRYTRNYSFNIDR